MITRPLGKQDYDHIVQVIDRWWGGPTSALAHPIFFYELGSLARVVEHDGIMVGFLFGFVAPGPPKTGYVHLVGIHPDYRRRRSEEHTSELQSRENLVCRLLLEKKKDG